MLYHEAFVCGTDRYALTGHDHDGDPGPYHAHDGGLDESREMMREHSRNHFFEGGHIRELVHDGPVVAHPLVDDGTTTTKTSDRRGHGFHAACSGGIPETSPLSMILPYLDGEDRVHHPIAMTPDAYRARPHLVRAATTSNVCTSTATESCDALHIRLETKQWRYKLEMP